MLASFSKYTSIVRLTNFQMAIVLPIWVLISFFGMRQLIVEVIIILYTFDLWTIKIDGVAFNTVIAVIIYALSIICAIGVPWFVFKNRTTKQEIGLVRLPSWMDIFLTPAAVVIYLLLSGILITSATKLLPDFNLAQKQDIAFTNIVQNYEYLLAFIALVVIAPVAEEVLFRGYLYGKLRKFAPIWAAILITSILFGAIHGQLNVAIDVFALSVVACSLREVTGNIWAGVLLHMAKNGIAFYLLFINP